MKVITCNKFTEMCTDPVPSKQTKRKMKYNTKHNAREIYIYINILAVGYVSSYAKVLATCGQPVNAPGHLRVCRQVATVLLSVPHYSCSAFVSCFPLLFSTVVLHCVYRLLLLFAGSYWFR